MRARPTLGMPPAAHAARRQELPRLTTMRGIGAVVIVIGHFLLAKSLPTKAMDDFGIDLLQTLAVSAVGCFFTLSGFVLTWVTPPGTPVVATWRRRFARLFPVHAVTWTLGVLVLVALGTAGAFWKMLPSLLLINVWVPNLEIFHGPNTPSWTLSLEAFFYLCFPVLLVWAWRIPERWLFRAVGAIVALSALWAVGVGLVVPRTHMITDGTPLSQLQYFAVVVCPPVRLLDFALGILLARIVIAGRVPSGLRPWLYISLIGGYVVARWVIPQPLGFVCAMLPAVIVGLLYSASADVAGSRSRWSTRTLLWLGEISYALYLVHWPVLFGAYRALGDPMFTLPQAACACLVALAVSIGLAHLLHTRVEVPLARRLGRSRKDRERAAERGRGAPSTPLKARQPAGSPAPEHARGAAVVAAGPVAASAPQPAGEAVAAST